jgi:hypothetical protein
VESRDLNEELNRTYEALAEISVEQRALNDRREAIERDRDAILIELGHISVDRWDVT